MKDSLGVNRGHCKDCREDECKDYKVQKNTDLFGYCGCYPVKHVKIRSEEKLLTKTQTAEEQAHQSRLNADAEAEEVVRFCFEIVKRNFNSCSSKTLKKTTKIPPYQ